MVDFSAASNEQQEAASPSMLVLLILKHKITSQLASEWSSGAGEWNMESRAEVGGHADVNKPQEMKGRPTRHVIAYIFASHKAKLNTASEDVVQQRKPEVGVVCRHFRYRAAP